MGKYRTLDIRSRTGVVFRIRHLPERTFSACFIQAFIVPSKYSVNIGDVPIDKIRFDFGLTDENDESRIRCILFLAAPR